MSVLLNRVVNEEVNEIESPLNWFLFYFVLISVNHAVTGHILVNSVKAFNEINVGGARAASPVMVGVALFGMQYMPEVKENKKRTRKWIQGGQLRN